MVIQRRTLVIASQSVMTLATAPRISAMLGVSGSRIVLTLEGEINEVDVYDQSEINGRLRQHHSACPRGQPPRRTRLHWLHIRPQSIALLIRSLIVSIAS